MLRDEKILVTGPAGQIAFPLARRLAAHNEVWGIARFGDPGSRARCEDAGITTRVVDLAVGDFHDLPDDFTVVLHLAAYLSGGEDFRTAIRTNAEGTGLLMQHCRRARAVLVMSTGSVFRPHEDPWHAYTEEDPLGDGRVPAVPTYAISKTAQEAVAHTMCRVLDLSLVIARMNVGYGANGGLPAFHLDQIIAGRPVHVRWDPAPYSPIHEDDIAAQVGALVDSATVPGNVVQWGGDEPVSIQQWCASFGELSGRTPILETTPVPGSHRGVVLDHTKRTSITGPCTVGWRTGMTRLYRDRYPNGPDAPPTHTRVAASMQALEP